MVVSWLRQFILLFGCLFGLVVCPGCFCCALFALFVAYGYYLVGFELIVFSCLLGLRFRFGLFVCLFMLILRGFVHLRCVCVYILVYNLSFRWI